MIPASDWFVARVSNPWSRYPATLIGKRGDPEVQ